MTEKKKNKIDIPDDVSNKDFYTAYISQLEDKISKLMKINKEYEEKLNKLTEIEKNHITETALDNYDLYDFIIENTSSIEELEEKLLKIIEVIKW